MESFSDGSIRAVGQLRDSGAPRNRPRPPDGVTAHPPQLASAAPPPASGGGRRLRALATRVGDLRQVTAHSAFGAVAVAGRDGVDDRGVLAVLALRTAGEQDGPVLEADDLRDQ